MKLTFFSSLRVRLLLLVLLAVVPALGLILYSAAEERQCDRDRAERDALRLVESCARDHASLVQNAQHVLMLLAQLPEIRTGSPAESVPVLMEFQRQNPAYFNFGLAEQDGDICASAVPFSGRVNITDRTYFRDAMATGRFSIGGFQFSRITGKPGVNFGYLVLDRQGNISRVLFATLTSESLTRSLGPDSSLFDGAVLSATDGDGLLLARYPENPALIGKPMPETALAWLMLGAQASGTAELPGPDGVRRLYTYTKVPSPGAGTLYMTVGIPSQVAYAQANSELRWGLASFGVVLLLALAAAWFGGELFVIRGTRLLSRAAQRMARGELTARTGMGAGGGELHQLARAFDEMADSLQRRDTLLRESEERFRLLVERVQDYAIIMLDPQGNVMSWNAGAKNTTGYSAEEIVGQPISRLYLPQQVTEGAVTRTLQTAAERGRFEDDGRRLRKDGSIFWANVVITPLHDDAGNLRGYAKVVRDVTERRRVEEALRDSEARLRAFFNASNVVMAVLELNGDDFIYRMPNDRSLLFLGLPMEQVEDKSARELGMDEAFIRDRVATLRYCLATGQSSTFQYRMTFRGREGWFEATISPIPNTRGGRLWFSFVATDITQRKLAENQLQVSEDRLRLAVQSAGLGMWDIDLLSGNVTLSEEARQIFGLPEAQPASLQRLIACAHADDRARVDQAVQHALDPSGDGEFHIEHRCLWPDGTARWVLGSGRALFADRGGTRQPVRFIGTIVDLSDRLSPADPEPAEVAGAV